MNNLALISSVLLMAMMRTRTDIYYDLSTGQAKMRPMLVAAAVTLVLVLVLAQARRHLALPQAVWIVLYLLPAIGFVFPRRASPPVAEQPLE